MAKKPLPNNQIVRSVNSDDRGNIFVGGYEEFGFWHVDGNGQWVYNSLSHEINSDEIINEEIWGIIVTEQHVYFQSFQKIYKYNYGGEIQIINPQFERGIMYLQSVGDKITFQALYGELYQLNPDNSYSSLSFSKFFKDKKVVFILPTQFENLMIGTEKSGIFILNEDGISPWNYQNTSNLYASQLNKATLLRTGDIAIGTILDGLFIFKSNGKLHYHINRERGLQNNTILSMKEDHSGNLWVGLDNGIDLIDLKSNIVYYSDKNGILGTTYSAALHNQHLYIGSNHGLFKTNWVKNFNQSFEKFELIEGTSGQVWNTEVIGKDLFCLHNDFTLVIKNDGTTTYKVLERGSWSITNSPINPNIIYIGTYNGIAVLEKKGNQWEYFKHFKFPSSDFHVKKLFVDSNGILWAINAYKGLIRVKLDETGKELIDYLEINKEPPLKTVALDFRLDPKGHTTHFES